MKAWLVLALLVAAAAASLAPTAAAHQCAGSNCGPCPEGEYHQHSDSSGSVCQSGVGGSQEAGPDGASQGIPLGALVPVAALAGAVLLVARRGGGA